ncbi:MAG: HU family DNA-binding protein, partial [Parachlamydiales bacterium]
METMTKKNLIQKISQKLNLHPKEVGDVVQNFLDSITETLSRGDRLEFRDFGVFEVVERK